MSFTVNIDLQDTVAPALLQLAKGVRHENARKVMGRAIVGAIKDNFRVLDDERANKMGGHRTHFYGNAAKSVQQPELYGGDGIRVAINAIGIAQRYYGGDIVPVDKQWLTIPARPETYGHVATEFSDLHFVFFREGLAALVQNTQPRRNAERAAAGLSTRAPKDDDNGGVFYWLVKHVHQDADITVLPTDETLQTAAVDAGETYIQRLLERDADTGGGQ